MRCLGFAPAFALLALLTGAASPLAAHPYHTTVAEAALNREAGTLEVALRVLPEDLERALERRVGGRIRLETTAGVDELIEAYLHEVFEVSRSGENGAAKPWPLRWVGKEVAVPEAWLYFEFAVPEGLEDLQGVRIRQQVFFELESDQINTVRLQDGGRRATLTFHRDQPVQPVPK